ncbi:substrate-binding periplasmic protein [Oceanospirillum sediminis]|uniref:Transporter substrate-binding domain-containing protein n=1 Tax=Oceanospirillum sediminis TaxID=2760088 RepID=A0A839IQT3_9GAMM|nr:transporter substrate-binding domain-containing protein [Oceanospirillum sediminis]MBB1487853.1 transporter substrate-binding domain-containing protein [Oceanospirillum sediminis]
MFKQTFLSLCLCFPLSKAIATENQVTLSVENSWPPYADKQGNGLSTSLVIAAFNAVGIKPIISVKPYARVLYDLQFGNTDGGYNVTRQQSTEERFHFGTQYLLKAPASFYYSDPEFSQANSLSDLPDNSRIGLIIDYEYGDTYEAHRHRFSEIRVPTQVQLIRMLMADRIDGAIMFDRVANYTQEQIRQERPALYKGFQNHVSDIYVAFSRSSPSSGQLAEALDRGLSLIRDNGQYRRIMSGELQYNISHSSN